jgi:hypothetical protein
MIIMEISIGKTYGGSWVVGIQKPDGSLGNKQTIKDDTLFDIAVDIIKQFIDSEEVLTFAHKGKDYRVDVSEYEQIVFTPKEDEDDE